MRITGITPNLAVADLAGAAAFYGDFLGLDHESLGLPWVTRYVAPAGDAQVQLVTGDATAPVDSVASLHTDDVDAAYAEAQRRGYEVVHPLTDEPWGVRRFFVRDPDGNVLNIVGHPG